MQLKSTNCNQTKWHNDNTFQHCELKSLSLWTSDYQAWSKVLQLLLICNSNQMETPIQTDQLMDMPMHYDYYHYYHDHQYYQ